MPVNYALKLDNTTYGKLDECSLDWNRDFSYEIRIYNTSGTKVAEIVGDMQDTTLESLEFELLRNGGCGAFSFILAEEFTTATIDYNYKIEICCYTQPNPWFTGFITEVPKKGTDTAWRYAGYGYFKQLDFVRVSSDDTTLEDVATKATGFLDTYVTPNTDIVKDTDKIETVSYTTTGNYKWERITARTCFERLTELATDYEFGVDEELDFYFRAIDTTVLDRFWIGKHLTEFHPSEDQSDLCNKLYIRCGRLTDGTDYVLYRENAASQSTYGLREDVVRAPEFFPLFSSTNLASGITPTTNPVAGTPANMTDSDYSTLWASGTAQASGHYIQVDLGSTYNSPLLVVLDSIHTNARDYYARGFTIKVSTNGSTWTTVVTVSENSAWKPSITFTPTSARYVRVTLTTSDANEWKVGEFEVYELDTADIERWGDYVLNDRKDIRKKATALIKGIDKIINKKQTITPIKPTGKIGVYEEDGTHVDDYAVMACKYFLNSDSFDVELELGELKTSPSSEIRKMLQRLKEYDETGVRNAGDLSGGTGYQEGIITETMISKDAVQTPHLMANAVTANEIAANSITTAKLAADAVTAAKINVVGLDGTTGRIIVADATDADEITNGINSYASTLITPGKIIISGATNLDDWRHASDLTLIDGGDIYATSVTVAKLNTDATNRIFTDSTTKTNIEAWKHASDVTKIDGGDIYTNTITATQISVSQLDAISANVGTLTAGIITSGLTINAGWRKIYEVTIGSQCTSFTVSGLDGNTDLEYKIYCRWVRGGANAANNYGIRCNNDSGNNYMFRTIYGGGASGSNATTWINNAYSYLWIGRADNVGELSRGWNTLHAGTGRARTMVGLMSRNVTTADAGDLYVASTTWKNTATNLASLVFLSSEANGIGIGSHIEVWERVA